MATVEVLAQMDWSVGQILDAVAELGIADDTIVIFTSDNGPEETYPWRGWAGPWSGFYCTAEEGSLRTPFVVRWPSRAPAGRVRNKIVHITGRYTTLARIAGAEIPQVRPVDGPDQTASLLGGAERAAREWFPVYVNNELYAVKWRNWKLHFVWQQRRNDAPQHLSGGVRLFNLDVTPQERPDESLPTGFTHGWLCTASSRRLRPFRKA